MHICMYALHNVRMIIKISAGAYREVIKHIEKRLHALSVVPESE